MLGINVVLAKVGGLNEIYEHLFREVANSPDSQNYAVSEIPSLEQSSLSLCARVYAQRESGLVRFDTFCFIRRKIVYIADCASRF